MSPRRGLSRLNLTRPRLAALCSLALTLTTSACDSSSPHVGPPRRFVLADTLTLTLPVESAWIRTVESDRLLLEHEALVLRVQEIGSDAGTTTRSAESVAVALATRYALGEQTGTLSHSRCRFASNDEAQCLTGTFERGDVPWVRRGAVIEVEGRVLWLDVAGAASQAHEVEAWSATLAQRASLGGQG